MFYLEFKYILKIKILKTFGNKLQNFILKTGNLIINEYANELMCMIVCWKVFGPTALMILTVRSYS